MKQLVLQNIFEMDWGWGVPNPLAFQGEKQDQFHRDLHSWQVNDCLYRAKNHATWVLPSLDVDEYFHMKDGSIFGILAGLWAVTFFLFSVQLHSRT